MASVQIAWDGGIPAGNQWVLMDGQTAIYSKELHKGGSVSKQPVMSHMGWTPFSKKKIITARFYTRHRRASIILGYAPHN